MNFIILGGPGCGKGTQAKKISLKFGISHLSTGEIFRKILEQKNVLSETLRQYVDKGILVPDSIVFDIINTQITNCQVGFILDGFPRNMNQAIKLDQLLLSQNKIIDNVLYIYLESDETIKRLTSRRICRKCCKNYNLITEKPKEDEICDLCKIKLIQRRDDKLKTVFERIKVYQSETLPLINYYEKQKKLIKISGLGIQKEVFKLILEKIGKNYN